MAGKRKKTITSEAELVRELGVSKLPDIVRNPAAEARLVQLVPSIAPELLVRVLDALPELNKAFNALIGTIESVGKSLEDTKRKRWEILHDLAKADKLAADQVLEAMRIIQEIEKSENIDWTKVFKRVAEVIGGAIVLVAVGILTLVGLQVNNNKS